MYRYGNPVVLTSSIRAIMPTTLGEEAREHVRNLAAAKGRRFRNNFPDVKPEPQYVEGTLSDPKYVVREREIRDDEVLLIPPYTLTATFRVFRTRYHNLDINDLVLGLNWFLAGLEDSKVIHNGKHIGKVIAAKYKVYSREEEWTNLSIKSGVA